MIQADAEDLTNPLVRAVIVALRDGDRKRFYAAFAPSAKLTDEWPSGAFQGPTASTSAAMADSRWNGKARSESNCSAGSTRINGRW